MALKYKTNEEGLILADDKGNPLVVDTEKDNIETGVDAIHLLSKIPDLQKEAKEYREAKEQVESRYNKVIQTIGGDSDDHFTQIRTALETVKTLDQKQMIDAGEVEKLKENLLNVEKEKYNELDKYYKGIISEKDNTIGSLQNDLYTEKVSTRFAQSSYFNGSEKSTYMTPEIGEAYFGRNFKVEEIKGNKQVVGYWNGEKIYSKEKPGEIAPFNEAIKYIIENHPDRETFFRSSEGSGAPGSGSRGGGGSMKNAALKKLSPGERLKHLHA